MWAGCEGFGAYGFDGTDEAAFVVAGDVTPPAVTVGAIEHNGVGEGEDTGIGCFGHEDGVAIAAWADGFMAHGTLSR